MLPTVPMMLLFFGLAHLCYIWLFWRVLAVRRVPPWAVVYALWFGILLAVLWPTLGALLIAVALYGVVLGGTAVAASRCHPLIAMGRRVLPRVRHDPRVPSSSCRTRHPRWASPVIMFTYCLGQGLIAAGVVVADRLRTAAESRRNSGSDAVTEGSARVDAWLWAVRVYKTRSAATTACRAGHVRVNGDRAKAAQPVRPGDELRVRIAGFDRILVVRQPISKRVGAVQAAAAVDDRTPPPPPRELTAFVPDARPRRRDARPSANGATSTSSEAATRVTSRRRAQLSRSSSQRAPRAVAPASVTRCHEPAIARHHRHRASRRDEALRLRDDRVVSGCRSPDDLDAHGIRARRSCLAFDDGDPLGEPRVLGQLQRRRRNPGRRQRLDARR